MKGHALSISDLLKLRRINSSHFTVAFSIVDLLAAVVLTTLTAAAVAPAFLHSAAAARQATCLSNERQIGLGLLQYAQDNDGTLMMQKYRAPSGPEPKWMDLVFPYVKNEAVFTCPDADPADKTAQYHVLAKRQKGRRYGTYGLNCAYYHGSGITGVNATGAISRFRGTPLSRIAAPASTVLMTEMRTGLPFGIPPPETATIYWATAAQNATLSSSTTPPTLVEGGTNNPIVILRHSGGANVLWCDGHASWLAGAELCATHTIKGTSVAYLWTIEKD